MLRFNYDHPFPFYPSIFKLIAVPVMVYISGTLVAILSTLLVLSFSAPRPPHLQPIIKSLCVDCRVWVLACQNLYLNSSIKHCLLSCISPWSQRRLRRTLSLMKIMCSSYHMSLPGFHDSYMMRHSVSYFWILVDFALWFYLKIWF